MKTTSILFTSVLAIGLAIGLTTAPSTPAMAAKVKGKIEKVDRGGRDVYIGGKKYSISGSRTNICVKGACDQDRGALKAGMKCSGSTSSRKKGMEFKKISCK